MQDKKSFDFVRFIKSQMLLVAGIVIFLIFGMIEHSFFTQSNIINIFRQIAVIAVMGAGMTYAIIGGNFDLSVGSLLSLCGSVIIMSTNKMGPVAAIVFTLSFGASAGSIMWNAVCAVDAGQREASLALGFTEQETFHQVVLPTAARRFLPTLSGQLVSLVKETSIVGYISVIDLTRATDLIRSRTMEAFFPLIVSAAIYFILCCAVTAILNVIIKRTDLNHRPREIKGVSA